jgi:hypothetical protein
VSAPEDPVGSQLRKLMLDAARQIQPSRALRVPTSGTSTPPRRRISRVVVVLGACVAAASAAFVVVAFGPRAQVAPGSGGGPAAEVLVIRADGRVQVVSLSTGGVLRTLVGPGAVDVAGNRLDHPVAVTASADAAYVTYRRSGVTLEPTIERIPLTGGPARPVASGIDAAVSRDDTKLALFRFDAVSGAQSSSIVTGNVTVQNLATGAQQVVYSSTGAVSFIESLSWSPDDEDLLMSGLFANAASATPTASTEVGVQLLDLEQPLSSNNPHFVLPPTNPFERKTNMSDGQFVGSNGEIAVLSNNAPSACEPSATRVLSVDTRSRTTSEIASVNFAVSQAYFDTRGTLVALERSTPDCREVPTTASTTTALSALGSVKSVGTTGGGSFTAGPSRYAVEVRRAGTWTEVAADVVAATIVP